MGQIFDITPTHHNKSTHKQPTQTKPAKSPSSVWLFLGLVIIIILVFTDISNSSDSKTKIAINNNQNKTLNKPDVLGESTTDNQNVVDSPDTTASPTSNTALPTSQNNDLDSSIDQSANKSANTISTQIDESQIKIKILNGSRVSGAAGTTKKKLEGLGYKIESIGTAKNTYKQTIIYYNTDKKKFATMVQLSLGDQNIVIEENPKLTANDDLLIVIGAK